MSTPDWVSDALQDPGDFSEAIAADVAGILTTLKSKLVTNGNWTLVSEVAGTNLLVKTPVKPSGVFLDVLFTKVDADTLEMRVRDQLAFTICTRRMDIEAAGNTTVEYYWGNDYVWVVSKRATAEQLFASILDPSACAAADSEVLNRVIGSGHRTTAGSADGNGSATGSCFAKDNGASVGAARSRRIDQDPSANTVGLIGPGGRQLMVPSVMRINQSGTHEWTGAMPMVLGVPSTIGFDTVKQIPVDTGTRRAFVVLPFTTVNAMRYAIRKPSADVP